MSTIIRKAVKSDARSLLILNEKFNGVTDVTLGQIEHSLEFNDREEVFVAQSGDAITAFCCVQVFKSFCYGEDYAEITEIYVDDAYQHRGVGTKLLSYVERHFENVNIKGFQLFTGKRNYSARLFYKKLGYKKSDEIMYRKRR